MPPINERKSDAVRKSSGAGSRGGHVIGTTKSGKPIYSGDHKNYAALSTHLDDEETERQVRINHPFYTKQDHLDAADAHDKQPGAKSIHATEGHAFAAMSFRKGTREIMSSQTILKNHLEKAKGEGSRGGHVIGHYRSGAPIYASGTNGAEGVEHHPAMRYAGVRDTSDKNLSHPDRKKAVAHLHKELFWDHSPAMHAAAQSAHENMASMLGFNEKRSAKYKAHVAAAKFHAHARFTLGRGD